MELAERKKKILKAIVESYNETGEPVGSKTLLHETGIEVSPATVRNDMADLTNTGYIYQPHTSAGRIPSQQGLRYYIDNLMTPQAPSERAKDYIDSLLGASSDTPEQLLREASKILSDYTGFAAVTTTPPIKNARVHRLHFVGTGRHTAMVVLVTSSGMVRSKLFRCSFVVTPDVLTLLRETMNKALSGVPLEEITVPFMQTVAASFGELILLTSEALSAIMDVARQAQIIELCTFGETRLLFNPEVEPKVSRGIVEFLNSSEKVAKFLLSQKSGLSVRIGTECLERELLYSTVISSRYEISGSIAGAVALFGPSRMNYAEATGIVAYIAQTVGGILGELVEGNE
ncbi:MAG: heat-inducible transcriptional repressor HrcA [Ruminococcus sp.]